MKVFEMSIFSLLNDLMLLGQLGTVFDMDDVLKEHLRKVS